ncbi:MAG TPA: hypothetical protein VGC69_01825 [Bordetella sp.]
MSALMGSGVLALWLDVSPELDRETDDWYVDEHLPERIDIGGYLRARRYRALRRAPGTPGYLSVFEATTPEALASEGYLSLVKRISPQSQRIRAGFSNVARNTFRVRATAGRGLGAVLASYRLKANGPADAGALDAYALGLLRHRGVVGVHWLQAEPAVRQRMDAVRAVGQSDDLVDYALLVETTRETEADALRSTALADGPLAAQGWRAESIAVYGLLYEVSSPLRDNETRLGDRT